MASVLWLVRFEDRNGVQVAQEERRMNPYLRPDALEFGGQAFTYDRQEGVVPVYRAGESLKVPPPRVQVQDAGGNVKDATLWSVKGPAGVPVYLCA